jgi:vacuolar-type H+-ATPase catalytic subunit A/Vma1
MKKITKLYYDMEVRVINKSRTTRRWSNISREW